MSLSEIERRLKHEKYFGDNQVDVVMAVIEQELTGDTDRDGANGYMVETGDIRYE